MNEWEKRKFVCELCSLVVSIAQIAEIKIQIFFGNKILPDVELRGMF